MVSGYETAYPRLKSNSSSREIQDIYTPNAEEIAFAQESTQKDKTYLLFLITLKTFERLGYFIDPTTIPMSIAQYVYARHQEHAPYPGLETPDLLST